MLSLGYLTQSGFQRWELMGQGKRYHYCHKANLLRANLQIPTKDQQRNENILAYIP